MDAYRTAGSQDSLPQGSSYGFGKNRHKRNGMDGLGKFWRPEVEVPDGHWAVNCFADQSFSWVALMEVIHASQSHCEKCRLGRFQQELI